jgi:Tfp pilus assembly protein PilF
VGEESLNEYSKTTIRSENMMKPIFFRLIFTAISFVLLNPNLPVSAKERRVALVIGNGAYKTAPLNNSVNDAIDIGGALTNLGFTVILKTNVKQRTMEETIREFGKQLRSGGVGLFYFAGHGLQVKGRNYLLPIGADIESEADIKYEAVDAGRVLAQMEEAGNGLNIVILDACRDNPFARSYRSSERGLAKMDAPEGSILAYATAPGSIAADGTGRNGLYTSKLLEHINTPGLPIELFFKEVRRDVRNASGNKQMPWTESSLIGDFYFNPKRGIAVVKQPKVKPQNRVRDTLKLNEAESLLFKGLKHFRQNMYQMAKPFFEKVLEFEPQNDVALYHLGYITYWKERNYPKALEYCNQAIEIDRGQAKYYTLRGLIFHRSQQFETARREYEKALMIDSNEEKALYGLGMIYNSEIVDYEKAFVYFDKLADLKPNNETYLRLRSMCKFHMKEYRAAIDAFDRLLEVDPKNCSAFLWKGYSYKYLGDKTNAIDQFRKTVENCGTKSNTASRELKELSAK